MIGAGEKERAQEIMRKYVAFCNEIGYYGTDGGCSCCGIGPDLLPLDAGQKLAIVGGDLTFTYEPEETK